MNTSTNLNPRKDGETWNSVIKSLPAVSGRYQVYNADIGEFEADYDVDLRAWFFVGGGKIGDSVVKWWR